MDTRGDGAPRRSGKARHPASRLALPCGLLALLLCGAVAGFFYAYSVSVLRGLDASDPRAAIEAMQGINATIRNPGFALGFFGAPLAAAAAALAFLLAGHRAAALALLLALTTYLACVLLPTAAVHVPMNEELARQAVPDDQEAALQLWRAYAEPWDSWNLVRTLGALASLLLVGLGLAFYRRR